MGLDIKRNKKGLYNIKSTISDEQLGKKWLTEDEVKKLLIERAYFKFIQNVIEIDMEFPSGYGINDRHEFIAEKAGAGSRWMINNWSGDALYNKFKEICERLTIEL